MSRKRSNSAQPKALRSSTTASSPPVRGGVVCITPRIDPIVQLQLLIAFGADLSRIEFLSSIKVPATSSHPSCYRPFTFPQDMPRLLEAVDRIDAKLIVLDPFIDLLSPDHHWDDQSLGDLLNELNQHFSPRNIACLITRDCSLKGDHACPAPLEHSPQFEKIAASHLRIDPDPTQPDRFLLTNIPRRH